MSYYDEVGSALKSLSVRVDPIIQTRLAPKLGPLPWTEVLKQLDLAKGFGPKYYSRADILCQLRVLTERLGGLAYPFDDGQRTCSTLGGELRIVRNRWAHNDEFEAMDVFRVYDFSCRLLEYLGDSEGAAVSSEERDRALRGLDLHGVDKVPSMFAYESSVDNDVEPTSRGSSGSEADSGTIQGDDDEVELVEPGEEMLSRLSDDQTPTIGVSRIGYEEWAVVRVGTPTDFDLIPKKIVKEKLRAVAAEIVEAEGPIQLDRLASLTGRAFGIQRLHKERAKKAIYQIRASGLYVDNDKFVWPQGVTPSTWDEFRPNSSSAGRDFLTVSPYEIRNAARYLQKRHGDDLSLAELQTRVLQTFGRKRRTSKFVSHLAKGLDRV